MDTSNYKLYLENDASQSFLNWREKMNGASGSNMVKIDAAIADKTNPNMLDNWYFVHPVNQRIVSGTITLDGTAKYFIDRWKLVSGSVTVTDTGLTLDGTIAQVLEDAPASWLNSHRCATVLVRTAQGTLTLDTTAPSYDDSSKTFSITGSGLNIVAAKFELGKSQTLAHIVDGAYELNAIPNYAEELAKCQRFCFRTTGGGLFKRADTAYGSTTFQFFLPCPVPMRTNPVVESALESPVIYKFSPTTGLTQETGFDFNYTAMNNGTIRVIARKVGHGLSDASIGMTGVVFSADL